MKKIENNVIKYPIIINNISYTVEINKNKFWHEEDFHYYVYIYKGRITGIFKLLNKQLVYRTTIYCEASSYLDACKIAIRRYKKELAKIEEERLANLKSLEEFMSWNGEENEN